MTDFAAIFAKLPLLDRGETDLGRIFSVQRIPGCKTQFVGRSVDSHPAFLIELPVTMRAPIALQNLRVTFGVQCRLSLTGEERTTVAAIFDCLSDDKEMQKYFLVTAGHALAALGDQPTPDDIVKTIDALVSLFQRLTRPSKRDAQGLFGELFVINLSANPELLVGSWHSDPMERFDFAVEDIRLEVKTSATRLRRHEFSLEQCLPPPGTIGILVSLFVESSGGGLSLGGLTRQIETKIASRPDLVVKLHTEIADTLGRGFLQGLDECFDEHLARASFSLYDLADVPAIRDPLPIGVSRVRFVSDLTSLNPVDLGRARQRFPTLGFPVLE